jgi:hypothetical protein
MFFIFQLTFGDDFNLPALCLLCVELIGIVVKFIPWERVYERFKEKDLIDVDKIK